MVNAGLLLERISGCRFPVYGSNPEREREVLSEQARRVFGQEEKLLVRADLPDGFHAPSKESFHMIPVRTARFRFLCIIY